MENNNLKKLLVAIPAYNEEGTIVSVIERIPQTLPGVGQIQVLVVDDGSSDSTAQVVKEKTGAHVISHKHNRGVGEAFHTAVDYVCETDVDILVTIDADGQFDPEDIQKLVSPILSGSVDFVTASRFADLSLVPMMPKIKLWGNLAVSWLISRLVGEKYYDVSCGFRAYSRKAFLRLNLFGRFTYTQEVFLDLSFKNVSIKEIPVKVKYFEGRRSRVASNLFSYAWKISNIALSSLRDYKPLSFFGSLGIVVFFVGFLLDVLLLTHFFRTGSFSPYIFVGATGALLNLIGLAFVALGFITDMLARVRMNQEKILYLLKKNQSSKK